MNEEEFSKSLKKFDIVCTKEIQNQFKTYLQVLLEYNTHTNLTAIKEEESVYLKHFYDSLTIKKFIKPNTRVLDIGTGAGFPGIPLAIVCPNTHFVLLDSNNKKIKFLEYLNTYLKLDNITIINERAEDYVRKHVEEFDVVTSRAVAKLRILAELSIPALKIGGKFIPLKSSIEEEIQELKDALFVLNGEIVSIEEFDLPKNGGKRTILEIMHNEKTKEQFPRSYDKILKKPLAKKQ